MKNSNTLSFTVSERNFKLMIEPLSRSCLTKTSRREAAAFQMPWLQASLKKEEHTSVFLAAVAAETKREFNLLYYIKTEVIHHKVTELQRKWVIAHL